MLVTPSMRDGQDWVIRDAVVADHPVLLSLNNAAAPHVNALEPHELSWLAENAAHFRVVADGEAIVGFVICLASGGDYWSGNYKWFTERYDEFLYLDRIVVADRRRSAGAGSALYADMHSFAEVRWPRVALEVNLVPPNEVSMRFHEKQGYVRVGIREADAEGKKVQMLVKEL